MLSEFQSTVVVGILTLLCISVIKGIYGKSNLFDDDDDHKDDDNMEIGPELDSEADWEGVGATAGILIWRVQDSNEQFKLEHWPVERFGEFCIDSSYIVLSTSKGKGETFEYEIYFWVGSKSTQREYRHNMLDDRLSGASSLYIVVESFESPEFLQIFKEYNIKYLSGEGAKEGNNSEPSLTMDNSERSMDVQNSEKSLTVQSSERAVVEQSSERIIEEQDSQKSIGGQISERSIKQQSSKMIVEEKNIEKTSTESNPEKSTKAVESCLPLMLLHVRRSDRVTRCYQVPAKCESLNQGDAFVLDAGKIIYTWFGQDCSPFEKKEAVDLAHSISHSRAGGARYETDVDSDEFWDLLGGKTTIKSAEEYNDSDMPKEQETKMYVLSDSTGDIEVTDVPVALSSLVSNDVCLLDTTKTIFVWIGKGSTKREKQQGLMRAQNYIKGLKREKTVNIVRVLEGQEKVAHGFMQALGEQ